MRISLQMPVDARARRLAERLARVRLNDSISLPGIDRLCREVGLSRRTAERLFIAQTGLTPARWRRQARLNDSVVNIAGGMDIGEAALLAGYRSRSAFYGAFNRTFGFAPG
ncbi:MAG: helix-turn-helix transcriptional regulator [Gammaproteobacteria bacterium]|nr:helix-turn-helix transcriptional regulator [Gammaproteobacteria bacterium]